MKQGVRSRIGSGIALLTGAFAIASFSIIGPAQAQEIRIGLLAPLTGPLAQPGNDMVNGHQLFWEEAEHTAGGREVRVIVADTACNPDQAITQARRLVDQEDVHVLVGPLCGHEGPAVAQVSRETGVPVILDPAGADDITKWDRVPTVVRTALSASQIGHPFGDYLYNELGLRNVTFIGQDYTFGQEVTLGAIQSFTELGGEVASLIWSPIGTTDYGPVIAGIPSDTDGVAVTIVGADRIRLFDAWFDFGMDRRHQIYGGYWLHEDALPQVDERAIGLISNALNYVAGIETPENDAFVDAFVERHQQMPSWMAESGYTSGLWTKTALDAIEGDIEDVEAFLAAVRAAEINAPRGPLKLDDYDNPIQNVYVSEVRQREHPVLGEILVNVPIKTYEEVSQFWTWDPEEFLARGPYQR
ncbi:ABC transporter substrate-binding protein [Aquibaculum sediminis]|uniref:ABC transporter substrate-binding protein n=1 Tax=Aquibaculum sediminis TaxID=3231907 RepID=UPI00345415A9